MENIFPLIHYVTFFVGALLMIILRDDKPIKQLSKDSGHNI